jgi:nitrile hydratase
MSHPDHSDHDHDHDHEENAQEPAEDLRNLEQAIRELLDEKGVVTSAQISQQIDLQDSRTPSLGAKVVAKAWVNAEFKRELLSKPLETINQFFNLSISTPLELVVLENTPDVHNIVVCTLCSCYPRMLLGIPPAWYKSTDYRSRVVIEPRVVLAEFGTQISDKTEVRVSDSTADIRYIVLPMRPLGTDGLTELQLEGLVTRDAMIGTALPYFME